VKKDESKKKRKTKTRVRIDKVQLVPGKWVGISFWGFRKTIHRRAAEPDAVGWRPEAREA
jgi:hypothetical protein